jgi:16S rRNA (guanine527-N7)-methyltransferase
MPLNPAFALGLEGLGLAFTEDAIAPFAEFEERLYKANQSKNYTRVPREECYLRHFLDSLLFHDLIPEGASVLDIGTGPGFPAWPLAVARPDLTVTAIDSNGKMLDFLRLNPLPNLRVKQMRAEEWPEREAFDCVTGRAVAPLSIQLEISAPLAKIGGTIISLRSENETEAFDRHEIRELGIKLVKVEVRALPGTEIIRHFPVYEKTKSSPVRYPRSWSDIKKKPL